MIEFLLILKNLQPKSGETEIIDDSDANKILKLYYSLLSQTKSKPTIVVVIGIVSKKIV